MLSMGRITSLILLAFYSAANASDVEPLSSRLVGPGERVDRIVFASCYVPQFEMGEIWNKLAEHQPDVLIMMGDNVYQSEEKTEPELLELREAYAMLAAENELASLREQTAVFATWDDHDYGLNNAGAEMPVRYESERLFETVWPLPQDIEDPRAGRDGIYHAVTLGPSGQRVQLILLDTRFFRGPLDSPDTSTYLGEAQWAWLEEQLQAPAELRLLVSSVPLLSEFDDAENWHRIPSEKARLLSLLEDAGNVVVMSGDSHYAAHYVDESRLSSDLHEFTASSLNFPYPPTQAEKVLQADTLRRELPYLGANFGLLEINWQTNEATIVIKGVDGSENFKTTISMTTGIK